MAQGEISEEGRMTKSEQIKQRIALHVGRHQCAGNCPTVMELTARLIRALEEEQGEKK